MVSDLTAFFDASSPFAIYPSLSISIHSHPDEAHINPIQRTKPTHLDERRSEPTHTLVVRSLYYVAMPPFGRRFHHMESRSWGYLD